MMKKMVLFSVFALSLSSLAQAKPIFGTYTSFIEIKTGKVIEIGSLDISEDGTTAEYFDYLLGKRRQISMTEVSKSTREEIAGVKAGEMTLVTTMAANSKTVKVSRYCEVFHLFENKQAQVGCRATEADIIPGYRIPNRFDFIINNVENIIAEVESSDQINKGEIVELRVNSQSIKANRKVRVLALFANGEALIQKIGFGLLDTSSIINKSGVDRVLVADLAKIN